MALSKTVTKKTVSLIMPKLYCITFNLTVADDTGGPGINRDFSVEFHTGDNVANKTANIIEQMQLAIDTYKAERQIFNAAALNTAVDAISGGLTL